MPAIILRWLIAVKSTLEPAFVVLIFLMVIEYKRKSEHIGINSVKGKTLICH